MTQHLKGLPRSLKGLLSEHHLCIDCGFNTAPGFDTRAEMEVWFHRGGEAKEQTITEDSEVYIVRDHVWAAAGMKPYGGCLCIGCIEKRLGRRLKPKDFQRDHPFNAYHMPCTPRLRDRRGAQQ